MKEEFVSPLLNAQDVIDGLAWITDTKGICADCPDDEGALCDRFSTCVPAICDAARKMLLHYRYMQQMVSDMSSEIAELHRENRYLRSQIR